MVKHMHNQFCIHASLLKSSIFSVQACNCIPNLIKFLLCIHILYSCLNLASGCVISLESHCQTSFNFGSEPKCYGKNVMTKTIHKFHCIVFEIYALFFTPSTSCNYNFALSAKEPRQFLLQPLNGVRHSSRCYQRMPHPSPIIPYAISFLHKIPESKQLTNMSISQEIMA